MDAHPDEVMDLDLGHHDMEVDRDLGLNGDAAHVIDGVHHENHNNGFNHDPGTSGITIDVEDGHHPDNLELTEGEVSPSSLRRSTRVSALKAQEKLKFKDGGMGFFPETNGAEESQDGTIDEPMEDCVSEPKKKKPCLKSGKDLDQYDCKFGVRMENEDVYMLTDESEISSLNEEEIKGLRQNYEEYVKAGVSSEQQYERDIQIKQLEAQVRTEENKLVMLRRTLQNQKEAEMEAIKKQRVLAEAAHRQQIAMGAYKAPVAANPATAARVNGTASKPKGKPTANEFSKEAQNAILNMDPATQKAFLQKLSQNPQLAQQFQKVLNPQFIQYLQQQQTQNMQKSASSNNVGTPAAAAPAPAASSAKKDPVVPTTTPAQRANEARRRLKNHLDQQLLNIPPPKSLISEINFIPSATNDFCCLLGLELTVQRVLKDKNVFKKYEEKPYSCEECGTDFTPSWKAIGQNENDLHLYCEACVRQAQKKKMKLDHAAVFKKAFAKIAEQERELEKQIAAGKFDDPPAPPPAPKPAPPVTPTSTAKASNSSGNVAPHMAAALAMLAQQQKKANPQSQQPSTSAQSSRSSQSVQQRAGQKRAANSSSSSTSNANVSQQQQMLMNMMRVNQALQAAKSPQQSNPQALAAIMQAMQGNSQMGQLAMIQALMAQQQGQNNAAAQMALMNNPFLQQMMALQANNMRNMNASKSRK